MHKIYGIHLISEDFGIEFAGEPQVIDETDDADEAIRLARNYIEAFGDGWRIWIVDASYGDD